MTSVGINITLQKESIMKRILAALSLIIAGTTFATSAQAGTEYHVYIKNGECTIETRDPETFKKQRGSDWQFIGKDSTRSGAEKIADKAGCD